LSTEVLKDPSIVQQPERLLNYTTIIEKENSRLKQHVERVLQMARLDKEDILLKKEVVDIHQLINDAIRNNTHALQEKNGTVTTTFDASRHQLTADKLHVTNVFNNIIDNAIKYSKDAPHIGITTRNVNGSLIVVISDNGIGIGPENQKKVFQKFYRVPTGNVHDVKGFGLGLSYVKTIIETHKGNIRLESELGKGCTFSITLPLDKQ
jgi:two-component system phosphate regulon sensor histidine kinase PhoR